MSTDSQGRQAARRRFSNYQDECGESQHFLSYQNTSTQGNITSTNLPALPAKSAVSHKEFLDNLKSLVDKQEADVEAEINLQIDSEENSIIAQDERDQKLDAVSILEVLSESDKEQLSKLITTARPDNIKISYTNLKGVKKPDPEKTHELLPAQRLGLDKGTEIDWAALANKYNEKTATEKANLCSPLKKLPLQKLAVCAAAALTLIASGSAWSLNNSSNENTDKSIAFLQDQDYQQALKAADQAVAHNPFSPAAQYVRGEILSNLLRYKEAEECFNKALLFNPSDKDILSARAAVSLKTGKPEQTIKDTKQLMAADKESLRSSDYGNLATAYYRTGLPDEALKYYAQAIELDPTNVALHLGRGYCLAGKMKFSEALTLCNTLVNLFPENYEVLALRGYCRQSLQDLEGASRDLDMAVKRAPQCARGYSYRAGLYMQLNKPEEALKDYVKLADIERDDAQCQFKAAQMLAASGKNKEAKIYFDRLAVMPAFLKSPQMMQERGQVAFNLGQYENAIKDFNDAQSLTDSSYKTLALAHAHLGQAREAREAIAQYTGKNKEEKLLAAARIDNMLGQTVSAIDKYSHVIAANPHSQAALTERADIYLNRKQWASAAADYQAAIASGATSSQAKANLAKCQNTLHEGAKVALDLPKNIVINFGKMSTAEVQSKAAEYYANKEMQMAVIYYTQLSMREPGNVEARRLLAHSQAESGDNNSAVSTFATLARAVRLTNDDKLAYAKAHSSAGRFEEAISILHKLHSKQIKAGIADSRVCLNLVNTLIAAGKHDEAITVCKEGIANGSNNSELVAELTNLSQAIEAQKAKAGQNSDIENLPGSTES